jgi:hypothetical protein
MTRRWFQSYGREFMATCEYQYVLFLRPYSGSTTVILCLMPKRLRLCEISGDRTSLLGRKNVHRQHGVRGASLHDAALRLQCSNFADAPG